jgi:2,5-diamino-6-(ribosylamino)-4(3H)-pyrimidinone 5'-phosphate reductase
MCGVGTLLLEGGGRTNGGLLRAERVHQVSLLAAPIVEGRAGPAALISADGEEVVPRQLALEGVRRREGDVLWVRYRVAAPT